MEFFQEVVRNLNLLLSKINSTQVVTVNHSTAHAARRMLKHVLVRHMLELVSGHVLMHMPARQVPEHMLQNSLLEPSLLVIGPLVSKILTKSGMHNLLKFSI